MKKDILLCWSGGKDSALALYEIGQSQEWRVASLLTTVTEGYARVSMHGVRQRLLERQAGSLGVPLEKVFISKRSSNEEYEERMKAALRKYKEKGITSVAFGDIFLEDLKKYREANLVRAGMRALFPLWKRDTSLLVRRFIELGFKGIISCVDSRHLARSFAGKAIDRDLVSRLPQDVDPCGENGEFHTFVFDGPIFSKGIACRSGKVLLRDKRFYYCDIEEVDS